MRWSSSRPVRSGLVLFVAAAAACHVDPGDAARRARDELGADLKGQTAAGLSPVAGDVPPLPPEVDPANGLTTQEAAAVALWRNPAFAAALLDLDVACADEAQAATLKNPTLTFLFASGSKQAEGTLAWPLDALCRRPARMRAAEAGRRQVGARLLVHGIELALRVERAVTERIHLVNEARIARRVAAVSDEVAALEQVRQEKGEVSAAEAARASAAAADAARATLAADGALAAVDERLRGLLDWPAELPWPTFDHPPRMLDHLSTSDREEAALQAALAELIAAAQAARPDARAAELAVERARAVRDEADLEWLRVSGLLDANSDSSHGWELGPGVGIELPLFDRGEALAARGQAALARAEAELRSTRAQIESDVRLAHAAFANAVRLELDFMEHSHALAEKARDRSNAALRAGAISQLERQRTELDWLAADRVRAKLFFDCIDAEAQLEQAVGRRLRADGERP